MLQRSEIGKTRSKKSQAQAMLNRVCVTPKGDKYSLVDFYKFGNKYHWVYEWIECPSEVMKLTTNRVQSKTQLGLGEIMTWMDELRSLNVC
jgi:hypothetical protein